VLCVQGTPPAGVAAQLLYITSWLQLTAAAQPFSRSSPSVSTRQADSPRAQHLQRGPDCRSAGMKGLGRDAIATVGVRRSTLCRPVYWRETGWELELGAEEVWLTRSILNLSEIYGQPADGSVGIVARYAGKLVTSTVGMAGEHYVGASQCCSEYHTTTIFPELI
jgi:hypothetical protein